MLYFPLALFFPFPLEPEALSCLSCGANGERAANETSRGEIGVSGWNNLRGAVRGALVFFVLHVFGWENSLQQEYCHCADSLHLYSLSPSFPSSQTPPVLKMALISDIGVMLSLTLFFPRLGTEIPQFRVWVKQRRGGEEGK